MILRRPLAIRGKVMEGTVKAILGNRAVVSIKRSKNFKKYHQRIFFFRNKKVVIPENFELNLGQQVTIAETRPVAKRISFTIVR